jgi:xylulokinase
LITVGIEIGTTSLKAVALNSRARVIREQTVRYPTRFAGMAAEQDATAWWRAACAALPSVAGGEEIAGVAVTCQAPTMVAVDANGDPLGKALTWIDRRAMTEAQEIGELLGESRNGADPFFGTAKLLWWARHGPDEIEKADAVLHANGFLVRRLTEVSSLDESGACMMQGWSDGWPALDGVPTHLLPDALPCLTVVGEVTRAAAEATGLPRGTPVAAGGIDAVGSALEAGVVRPGDPLAEMTGFSTMTVLAVRRGATVPGLIHSRHCVDGVDLLMTAQASTGAVVDWVRDVTGVPLDSAPLLSRRRPSRLLVVPSFAGERTPGWDARARGAVLGLDLDTDPQDLLLAVLEGTALALRADIDTVERAGFAVPTVTATGGGASNDAWLQIKADVLDREVQVPDTGHGSAVGAALMAGLATDMWAGPDAVRDFAATPERRYLPHPGRALAYGERFELFQGVRSVLPPFTNPLLP